MMDARLEELDAKKREKIRKNCKSLGGKVCEDLSTTLHRFGLTPAKV